MRFASTLALPAVLAITSSALAQVQVRAPGVQVDVGRGGVFVAVPGFTLNLPRGPRMLEARLLRREAPPRRMPRSDETFDYVPGAAPPPVPIPAPRPLVEDEAVERLPVEPDEQRPPTPAEFAAGFEPRPGSHAVVLTHPTTRKPVTVRFRLPAGEPGRVRVKREEIRFEYPRRNVVISFAGDGRVRVAD